MRRTFLHLNPWFVADQTGSAVGVDMLRLMKKVAGWFIGLLIDWFSDSFNAWAEKKYIIGKEPSMMLDLIWLVLLVL